MRICCTKCTAFSVVQMSLSIQEHVAHQGIIHKPFSTMVQHLRRRYAKYPRTQPAARKLSRLLARLYDPFTTRGGGAILPSPFPFAGSGGTLNPPFAAPFVVPAPTCVKVPLLNHRSSSASLFLFNSALAFGSTNSKPCTGVNAILLAVPAVPTPLLRSPCALNTVAFPAPCPKPRRLLAGPPKGVTAPQPVALA